MKISLSLKINQNVLVIIGQALNEGVIRFEQEECLCTEAEILQIEQNGKIKDLFPASITIKKSVGMAYGFFDCSKLNT